MIIHQSALVLVVVWLTLAHVADCCNRTPAPPSPPISAPIPDPAIVSTPLPLLTTSPASQSHRLPCTGPEIQRTACLNRGTCFAVILENTRQSFCSCPAKYSGRRCQDAQLPPGIFFSMENIQTANIATGVTVAIIVIVVILLSLYVYIRWRKKVRQSQSHSQTRSLESSSTNDIGRPYTSSRHNSISSHPSKTMGSDPGEEPGENFTAPLNGATYQTMQPVDAKPGPGTVRAPWTLRDNIGEYYRHEPIRHSHTDNGLHYQHQNYPSHRSESETTV